MRLWVIEHPYYCNQGDCCKNGAGDSFKSWQEFLEEYGDADFDMNLVFRFDFVPPKNDDDKIVWQGDCNYRDCRLKIFWMGQRKGYYHYSIVEVCRADEPIIKIWLQKRFNHLLLLWAPITKTAESRKKIKRWNKEKEEMKCKLKK